MEKIGVTEKISFFKGEISKKRLFLAVAFLAFFVSGFLLGKWAKVFQNEETHEEKSYQEIRQGGYQFIDPLLECEIGKIPSFKSFENQTREKIIEEVVKKNPQLEISVYFRGLKNGPWFGIDEDKSFSPASLLKVPLMVAYFKLSEDNPEILEKKIVFNPSDFGFRQSVPVSKKLEKGKQYSVMELIEEMIVHSDNEALGVLFQNIDEDYLSNVFSDLGVGMPDIYSPDNSMTVKDFASFFRILYNASYLDKEMSEKGLEILSRADFKGGISKGVSPEIVVAHKFGEREEKKEKKIIRQLHDCGIVYYEPYPYLICLMSKGDEFESLSKVLSLTSRIIFEEVSSRYD